MRALILMVLITVSCVDPAPHPNPPPNPPPDTNMCSQMCEHLSTLSCEEAQSVYNNDLPGPVDVPNQSCADWCTELQLKGFFVNPRCVSLVPKCDQIEVYRLKDPKECLIPQTP